MQHFAAVRPAMLLSMHVVYGHTTHQGAAMEHSAVMRLARTNGRGSTPLKTR